MQWLYKETDLNECYPSLGGTGGTLFAQHYSCPAVLRCSVHW